MIGLLLRLYPARWRARYGDEFAAVLGERALGPFDVADVVLGAIDAHLHLRGLGAASEHRKGYSMTLRIGGIAALVGGPLWAFSLIGSSMTGGEGPVPWLAVMLVATLAAPGGARRVSAHSSLAAIRRSCGWPSRFRPPAR